ncbi:MAG: OFA family MFS transporter, partial [Thermoleophilaceae bacterium]|nr:OFA family MFS transporter [Thermoleophilaceae bacterium]
MTNRWVIAAAGVVMQIALGAVYAWSVFRKPLSKEFDTSVSTVNLTFTLTIVFLGISAYFGGLWMAKSGPRIVAITGGLLYAAGLLLASLSSGGIALLYLSYGVLAGIGIGLGYIVPIATLIKWFPDKRGIITGVAVAGFGAGAVVTAPVAKSLIGSVGVFETFAILGVAAAVLVVGAAMFISNPPEGYKPEGWDPDAAQKGDRSGRDFQFREALSTWQWFALWALLFLNVTAGIAVISEAAPMAEEIGGASATAAASLVSIIAIFNGIGRFAWASFSDVIGRRWVFLAMFAIQAIVFFLLPNASSYALFAVLACVILFCYGGGFGTMPAFAADYFGSANVGRIYGLMLTAWSAAGVAGPLLISKIRDSTGEYDTALYIIA